MTSQPPVVDLTNCDKEPIHILGAIQPVGFLMALTADWMVVRVSLNIETFTGRSAEDLLGKPIQDVLSHKAVHDLRNRSAILRGPDAIERLYNCILTEGGDAFDVALHYSGGQLVIEAEPASGEHGDATGMVRSMIVRLDQAADFDAFYREGARQIRALLGYDRVMVYRFAQDGSG